MSYSIPRYKALKLWPPGPTLNFFKAMGLKVPKSVSFPRVNMSLSLGNGNIFEM